MELRHTLVDIQKLVSCLMQVLSHPDIQAEAQAFLDSRRGWPVSQRRKVCVLQREFAVLDFQREPDSILYSVEATTCLIVAAVQGSRAVLTHIDDYRQLPDLLQSMHQPSIWLLGAFCDPKGQGPLLAGQVLKVMPGCFVRYVNQLTGPDILVGCSATVHRHAALPPLAACCKVSNALKHLPDTCCASLPAGTAGCAPGSGSRIKGRVDLDCLMGHLVGLL